MNAHAPAKFLQTVIVAVIITTALSATAKTYSGCDKDRFGSQEGWFCMSDKDGES